MTVKHNSVLRTTFQAGSVSVDAEVHYVGELVTRLEKALGYYQESDEQAEADMGAAGDAPADSKGYGEG
ncbi:hypothetical protein ACFS2C_06725 [Prauserella oleivorans]|uniref:Uncharacterized protein n=1 Tax=Prauserella oleivorans TaxID=1478153 RepID=A0ABW5W671_9PSEU